MKEKVRKRKVLFGEIEKVLDATCRRCVVAGVVESAHLCNGCNAFGVLEKYGYELGADGETKKPSDWTPEQDAELIELYRDFTLPEITEIMGLKGREAKNRINLLRKKGVFIPLKTLGGHTKWTPEKDQRLIEVYKDNTLRKTAEILGMTTAAVENRVKKLRKFGADIPPKINKGKGVMK